MELHSAAGALLANGELVQLVTDGGIESRMVFHLPNSVFQETVAFSQNGVFALRSYHLIERGPAFDDDVDVTMAASGDYVVHSRLHKSGKETTLTGRIALPADVYNGMVITIAKNIPGGAAPAIVHMVAFTPQPHLLQLELTQTAERRVLSGKPEEATRHLLLHPKLGMFLRIFASMAGKSPPDSDLWIVSNQVPAYVRFEGRILSGPSVQIDLMGAVP